MQLKISEIQNRYQSDKMSVGVYIGNLYTFLRGIKEDK